MPNVWQIKQSNHEQPWTIMNNHEHLSYPMYRPCHVSRTKNEPEKNTGKKITPPAGGCRGDRTGLRDTNHDGFDWTSKLPFSVFYACFIEFQSCAWAKWNQHKFTSFLVFMELVRANQFVPTEAMLCRLSENQVITQFRLTKSSLASNDCSTHCRPDFPVSVDSINFSEQLEPLSQYVC